jgi:hypothetical protein
MEQIAGWMAAVAEEIEPFRLPEGREERAGALRRFRQAIQASPRLATLREEVRDFCLRFPVPGT